ncbi:PucR family transcriptional regulator [Oceanobacillus halophilus]|uniref:PucR family transcriptional regulator n=1 Tax=Oceanobacillus halophilus TaxID=930130 RepID=A0A495A5R2_9BACI|nr:PucR family transcriptional regulator [Oceanobacillus halophilus]RKQ34690.1 PucR family transcriptional regulator [Oceanobacillus halophilus]
MEKWSIRVKDILSRDLFKNAVVVSGKGGLNREIKWTHILESGDIESFINGGELILTTGSGIAFDAPEGITHLDKLVKKNVAGVVIELGTHVKKIAPEIIQYGNDHNLPLITFNEIVKFVDITQDLHTVIVNHHHQMLNQLYTFSEKINELSLLPNGILKILKELHTHFHAPVLFVSDDTKAHYYPPKIKSQTQSIHTLIKKTIKPSPYKSYVSDKDHYTIFPIRGLGHTWGYLCLQMKSESLDEFSFSVVDRAALAIAQIMLRNKTIEERKQNQEEEIVRSMVKGKNVDATEVQKILPSPAKNLYYRLFLINMNSHHVSTKEDDWEEVKLQQAIIIRSLFRKNGFVPAVSVGRNEIAIIAAFYMQKDAQKDTKSFSDILLELKNIQQINIFNGKKCTFGISNVHHDYAFSPISYKEAKDVILIQKANLIETYFYEKIGVYRLLLEMYDNDKLHEFIQDYIGPILRYDREMKSELLLTLSVYLKCMGSKKETANQLFIVRQTLYHRLQKIEELLRTNLMEPINRQAIELALSAYYLLQYTSKKEEYTNTKQLG